MCPESTGIARLLSWLVLFLVCCGGEQNGAECASDVAPARLKAAGEACRRDGDCQTSFCDRDVCIALHSVSEYGNQCQPPAPDARPVDKLPERLCGGYLCQDGRCRSCRSDAECQSTFGMGTCTVVNEPARPKRGVCNPETTRRPPGTECSADAECRSLLCDRGICAEIRQLGLGTYGDDCASTINAGMPPAKCEGYICMAERCRSCQSDAECEKDSSGLKCLSVSNWPGKVCITPSAAQQQAPHQIVSIPGRHIRVASPPPTAPPPSPSCPSP